MEPRIELLKEKKLIGVHLTMSYLDYKVTELWDDFIRKINTVNLLGKKRFISMTIYPPSFFLHYKSTTEFEKWAMLEVLSFDNVPSYFETYIASGGLYAVFNLKRFGKNKNVFQFILDVWLPMSKYVLDDRPHFEIFQNNNTGLPDEIWIPIKLKKQCNEDNLLIPLFVPYNDN